MDLGIVAALDWEHRLLVAGLGAAPGLGLRLAGLGAERAALAADALLDDGAGQLLSAGCCAALDPALKPGDVVLPARVLAPDGEVWPLDPDWHASLARTLAEAGLTVQVTDLAHSDTPLLGAAQKAALGSHAGAGACDMESLAVARAASRRGVPCAVVRVVLDDARQALPAAILAACDEYGRARGPALIAILLREPGLWPELLRLARCRQRAAASLRRVAALLPQCQRLPLAA
jgi:adenosylhomocysteine nucleosidase